MADNFDSSFRQNKILVMININGEVFCHPGIPEAAEIKIKRTTVTMVLSRLSVLSEVINSVADSHDGISTVDRPVVRYL